MDLVIHGELVELKLYPDAIGNVYLEDSDQNLVGYSRDFILNRKCECFRKAFKYLSTDSKIQDGIQRIEETYIQNISHCFFELGYDLKGNGQYGSTHYFTIEKLEK